MGVRPCSSARLSFWLVTWSVSPSFQRRSECPMMTYRAPAMQVVRHQPPCLCAASDSARSCAPNTPAAANFLAKPDCTSSIKTNGGHTTISGASRHPNPASHSSIRARISWAWAGVEGSIFPSDDEFLCHTAISRKCFAHHPVKGVDIDIRAQLKARGDRMRAPPQYASGRNRN